MSLIIVRCVCDCEECGGGHSEEHVRVSNSSECCEEGTRHLPCSVSSSSAPILVTLSSMSLFQSTDFCE